ncbi:hypothetical protein ABZ863_14130 [Saccharomonospora sp. NPDC046836]|uniref:hypothetical protein n=1 Tax=Saccharomonospora sp. NPDC046836 TaxID=3156921 RepID=UPI0033E08733
MISTVAGDMMAFTHLSLLSGAFPWTLRVAAGALLLAAVVQPERRWLLRRLPVALGLAALGILGAAAAVAGPDTTPEPLPAELRVWLAALVFAVFVFGSAGEHHGGGVACDGPRSSSPRWRRPAP